MDPSLTRRGFVRGALVGGVAAVGVAGEAMAAADPLAGAVSEADVLARLAEIEQLALFCYRHLMASITLSAPTTSALKRFISQELVHLRMLGGELAARGGKLPAPLTSIAAADAELGKWGESEPLTWVINEYRTLKVLVGVETIQEQAYHDAVLRLSSPALASLCARILTCEAQHWTVLSELLHIGDVERAVPHAFVPLAPELKT